VVQCRVRERTKMSKPVPAIRTVKARGLVVPLSRPVKNARGPGLGLEWNEPAVAKYIVT
jgi:hypothetical protein